MRAISGGASGTPRSLTHRSATPHPSAAKAAPSLSRKGRGVGWKTLRAFASSRGPIQLLCAWLAGIYLTPRSPSHQEGVFRPSPNFRLPVHLSTMSPVDTVAHGETVRSNVLPLPPGERGLIFCCPTFGESDYILEMDGSTDFCMKTQHTAQKRTCIKMGHKETDFLSITRYLCHLCKVSLHFFALRRLVL